MNTFQTDFKIKIERSNSESASPCKYLVYEKKNIHLGEIGQFLMSKDEEEAVL